MSEENGVTVTVREIYDSLNSLTKEVSSLGDRFQNLEQSIQEQNKRANEAKNKSDEAIQTANKAERNAKYATDNADKALKKAQSVEEARYKEKIEENETAKSYRIRFYIAIVSSSIPWIVTVILGLIYFAKTGGF